MNVAICPICNGSKNIAARKCRKCFITEIKSPEAAERRKERNRKYYTSHKELLRRHYRAKHLRYTSDLRIAVLEHYGNGELKCVRCGFDNPSALDIDHVDGVKNYEEGANWHGLRLYRWLEENSYPEGFQTLCRNCNWLKYIDSRKHI